jgi:endonuclease/exonuclease/phosphatase family metal-dependent hydrolase
MRLNLSTPTDGLPSYPSWQPQRAIDHILLAKPLLSSNARVVEVAYSDHCPVELEVQLPPGLRLRQAVRPVVSVETQASDAPD